MQELCGSLWRKFDITNDATLRGNKGSFYPETFLEDSKAKRPICRNRTHNSPF